MIAKKNKIAQIYLCLSLVCLLLFFALIASLKLIDVAVAEPVGCEIGLSHINLAFKNAVGTNLDLWHVTEYLGFIAIACALLFALLGACQLIKRRSFKKVDKDIYLLALVYIAVMIIYVFFEKFAVNYRPIFLISDTSEPSFPSSHTMLVMCIMMTAAHQAYVRIKNRPLAYVSVIICALYTVFMVVARLISGVHWLTDIIGGILISLAIFFTYLAAYKTYKINK